MKKNKFDENLKNDLQQYISKVDTNALWANIEIEVDAINKNKQKKNRFFIWFFCVGISLLGGTLYWVNIASNSSIVSLESTTTSTQIVHAPTALSKKENNISNTENPTVSNITVKETTEFPQKKSTENSLTKSYFSKNIPSTTSPFEYSTPTKNKNTLDSFYQNLTFIKEENSTSSNSLFTPIVETPTLPVATFLLKNPFHSFNKILTEDWNFVATPSEENLPFPRHRKKPLQLAFGIQGGISQTNRRFERKQSETIDFINLRKQSEEVLETVHLGALLNLTHQSGLEFSTGVQWTQITEKFEFKGSTIEMDTIENGLFGYIINPNGDTIPVYDQVVNQQEIFYNKKTYNKYRMIEIPVSLSYHWKNDTWSFGIESGVVANISLKTSGNIFNPNGQIIDIDEEQNKVFRSAIGLSYHLGLSGRYFITDHLQITASPAFRFFPKNFALSNYSINQKYYLLGGYIGLRFIF